MKHIRVRTKASIIAGTDTECILVHFGQLDNLVRVACASIDTLKTAMTINKQTTKSQVSAA